MSKNKIITNKEQAAVLQAILKEAGIAVGKRTLETILWAYWETIIKESIEQERSVSIGHYGKLVVRHYADRKVRSPLTNLKRITVKGGKRWAFKPIYSKRWLHNEDKENDTGK